MSGEPSPDAPAPDPHAGDPPPTGPRRTLRTRPWRLGTVVIAVALLAEFVALIGHPLFGWGPGPKRFAATPASLVYHAPLPPSGAEVLLRLSETAARAGAGVTIPSGAYRYVKRQTWQLPAAASGAPPPASVVPVVTESWRAPDGDGRIARFIRRSSGVTTEQAGVVSGDPLPALSTSATVMARRLQAAAPAGPGPAREFIGFVALAGDQPIPAEAEAVILGLLARIPGVTNSGAVVDRAGRAGVSVSLDSDASGEPVRYTLIFAPATGALLEADQTLSGDPQAPDVRPGAVMAYTTFLAAGYVDSTTASP
jgi:hypothetical protein